MNLSALDYGKLACDTLMDTFSYDVLPPKKRFHYHCGVFLSGMQKIYALTKEKKYFDYIKNWIDMFIDDEGKLTNARTAHLDDLQPSVVLFELYEQTGDERYKKVLDYVDELLCKWETNEYGGFWHMDMCPNQMWLDSFYMGCPNVVLYGARFGKEQRFDTAYLQMKLMWDNMRDSRTGLLYHSWDATKIQKWADPVTGLAPEFWCRALGWYAVTLFDLASYMPDSYEKKKEFIKNGVDLINSVLLYRDENTKKWFQILNRGNDPENWLETSSSCLFTYAIAKGVNEGYLGEKYKEKAKESYDAIISDINIKDGKMEINDICIGTGVMTYGEYLERPRTTNDLHGVGAFVLMCSEITKMDIM